MSHMSNSTTEKTTLYLQPAVKKYLQHKAIEDDMSMSEIVNVMVEDMLDSIWLAKHGKELHSQPTVSFEEALAEAGLTYDDLRN